jgi:hypothetical protein
VKLGKGKLGPDHPLAINHNARIQATEFRVVSQICAIQIGDHVLSSQPGREDIWFHFHSLCCFGLKGREDSDQCGSLHRSKHSEMRLVFEWIIPHGRCIVHHWGDARLT